MHIRSRRATHGTLAIKPDVYKRQVQVLQQGQEVLTSTWFIVTATILLVLAAAYAILAILMNRKNKKVRRVKKYRDL